MRYIQISNDFHPWDKALRAPIEESVQTYKRLRNVLFLIDSVYTSIDDHFSDKRALRIHATHSMLSYTLRTLDELDLSDPKLIDNALTLCNMLRDLSFTPYIEESMEGRVIPKTLSDSIDRYGRIYITDKGMGEFFNELDKHYLQVIHMNRNLFDVLKVIDINSTWTFKHLHIDSDEDLRLIIKASFYRNSKEMKIYVNGNEIVCERNDGEIVISEESGKLDTQTLIHKI